MSLPADHAFLHLDIETVPPPRSLRSMAADHPLELPELRTDPPGNYRKPETIARWHREEAERHAEECAAARAAYADALIAEWRKLALQTDVARPVVVVWAEHGAESWHWMEDDGVEHLLERLQHRIEMLTRRARAVYLCGSNVGFDVRLLYFAAARLNHPLRRLLPWERPWVKPWEQSVQMLDLGRAWAGVRQSYGRPPCGLDHMARVSGYKRQAPIDGGDVCDCWLRGDLHTVLERCRDDVAAGQHILSYLMETA